jgi:hypothetical protein
MSREEFALWVIVLQGFAVMYFEYDIWRMKRDGHEQRKKWREDKRRLALKKLAVGVVSHTEPASGVPAPVDGPPTFARKVGLRTGRRVRQILRVLHAILVK